MSSLIRKASSVIARPMMIFVPKATRDRIAKGPGFRGRIRTMDVAFPFRMGTGFAGDVNRTHPFNVVPRPQNATNPVLSYGYGVILVNDGSVRQLIAADEGAVTDIYGVAVRPYPIQQPTTTQISGQVGFGSVTPPTNQPIDVLIAGFILVPVNGAPAPGGLPHIWCTATAAPHVAGQWEAAASAGNTADLTWDKIFWHSPAGSDGIAELSFNN